MPARGEPITLDEFFAGREPESRELFEAVRLAVEAVGDAEVRATKSQVVFRRRIGFAWVWIPGQYLSGPGMPPLVLAISLRRRDESPRWKQVVEPYAGRFMHHLELTSAEQIDDGVRACLHEAWKTAG